MGRTLDAARHYADTPETIIEPAETARAVFTRNPPGTKALKVLLVLMDVAGPRLADDIEHEIKLSELNNRTVTDRHGRKHGLHHHDSAEIRETMNDLATALLRLDEPDRMQEHIGTVAPYARIDYSEEANGDLAIRWEFGKVFRMLAERSDLYARLDTAALLAMRSRYAIALLRHCSTHFGKTRTDRETLTVDHLRKVLGVPEGRLKRFSTLNQHALQTAIAEINATSRWTLEATHHKTGRTVTSVTISWTEKPLAEKREAKAELGRHSAGRKHRQDGTAEQIAEHVPFPEVGGIAYSDYWLAAKRETAAAGWDNAKIADKFRAFCESGTRRIRLDAPNIRKIFINWANRVGKPP